MDMIVKRRVGHSWLAMLLAGASCAAGSVAPGLAQTTAPERAPWSAPASAIIVQEEKTFRNGPTELSGTLHLPRGGNALAAVVVTHAASSPLRNLALYRHLKEMLPPLGMAVFVYDRRGSGKSGGDLGASDYPLLADDAIAAARMLKTDARIDPKRIGVWGLSQGGWLSLLAATRSPDIAFAISISAPMVTPDVQMIFYSANALRVNGYSQADIDQAVATRKTVDDYMRGLVDRATAQRMLDAAKVKPWFKLLHMGESPADRATSRWRKEIAHDPMRTLEEVRIPALVIYGAADPVVPVAASMERLNAVAAKYPALEVVVVAGADHHMQLSVDPKTQMDPARSDDKRPEAPEYFGILASWLTKLGAAQGLATSF